MNGEHYINSQIIDETLETLSELINYQDWSYQGNKNKLALFNAIEICKRYKNILNDSNK